MNNSTGQWGRRQFLRRAALVGTAGLIGLRPEQARAEPPPETTTLRLLQFPSGCQGPIHVAEELLRLEGFTDVRYVRSNIAADAMTMTETHAVDISFQFAAPLVEDIDRGAGIVTLGGVHAGCFVLFGNRSVRSVLDLKGKTVSVPDLDGRNAARVYIASMAAYVGLNPSRDITWVAHPVDEATRLFADGKVDAIMGFPPLAQELRAKKIGHVVVDSTSDRPWSQHFCCMIVTARDFPKKYTRRPTCRRSRTSRSAPVNSRRRLVRSGPGSSGWHGSPDPSETADLYQSQAGNSVGHDDFPSLGIRFPMWTDVTAGRSRRSARSPLPTGALLCVPASGPSIGLAGSSDHPSGLISVKPVCGLDDLHGRSSGWIERLACSGTELTSYILPDQSAEGSGWWGGAGIRGRRRPRTSSSAPLGLLTVAAVAVPLEVHRAPEPMLHRRPARDAERAARALVRMVERYVIGVATCRFNRHRRRGHVCSPLKSVEQLACRQGKASSTGT
jgi:ABC-type nitrate/sulfonate/bicarbonate transport system substrate-binding protein